MIRKKIEKARKEKEKASAAERSPTRAAFGINRQASMSPRGKGPAVSPIRRHNSTSVPRNQNVSNAPKNQPSKLRYPLKVPRSTIDVNPLGSFAGNFLNSVTSWMLSDEQKSFCRLYKVLTTATSVPSLGAVTDGSNPDERQTWAMRKGEKALFRSNNVNFISGTGYVIRGEFRITNYQLTFFPEEHPPDDHYFPPLDYFEVPLSMLNTIKLGKRKARASIAGVKRSSSYSISSKKSSTFSPRDLVPEEYNKDLGKDAYKEYLRNAFVIKTKDLRTLCFSFSDSKQAQKIAEVIKGFAFDHNHAPPLLTTCPAGTWGNCAIIKYKDNFGYATSFKAVSEEYSRGHKCERSSSILRYLAEFHRMGALQHDKLRLISNVEYTVVTTYPRWFIIPSVLSDKKLAAVAKFRTKSRLPALSYFDNKSGAMIFRSSQPRTGLTSKRSSADEEMLLAMMVTNFAKNKLLVLDCRPRTYAEANRAKGGGYEGQHGYGQIVDLEFLNIGNIHDTRSAFYSLRDVTTRSTDWKEMTWLSIVEETKWLVYLRNVLLGALKAAECVSRECRSVLVHCSDGWDRTAQVCGLAELLLEPFYRTVTGFQCLIEREWAHFGHQFALRHGHGEPENKHNKSRQNSPVFVQFLDCVWQLLNMFPTAFEFTSRLLLILADAVNNRAWGDFLGNTQYERLHVLRVETVTESVWDAINRPENRPLFVNPLFNPSVSGLDGVLLFSPASLVRGVSVWKDFWMRWSSISTSPIFGALQYGADSDLRSVASTDLTYASAVKYSLPKFTHSMLLPTHILTDPAVLSAPPTPPSPTAASAGDEDFSSDEENDSAEPTTQEPDRSQCGAEFLVDVSASELTAEQRSARAERLVASLVEPRRNILLWLLSFANRVKQSTSSNKMNIYSIALCLGPSLFEAANTQNDVLETIRHAKEQNMLIEDLIAWAETRLVGAQRDTPSVAEKTHSAKETKDNTAENVDMATPAAAAAKVSPIKVPATTAANTPSSALTSSTQSGASETTEAAPPIPVQSVIVPLAARINFLKVKKVLAVWHSEADASTDGHISIDDLLPYVRAGFVTVLGMSAVVVNQKISESGYANVLEREDLIVGLIPTTEDSAPDSIFGLYCQSPDMIKLSNVQDLRQVAQQHRDQPLHLLVARGYHAVDIERQHAALKKLSEHSGWILKKPVQKKVFSRAKPRFFKLRGNKLRYYTNDTVAQVEKGCLTLSATSKLKQDSAGSFTLSTEGKKLYAEVTDPIEMSTWTSTITLAIEKRLANLCFKLPDEPATTDVPSRAVLLAVRGPSFGVPLASVQTTKVPGFSDCGIPAILIELERFIDKNDGYDVTGVLRVSAEEHKVKSLVSHLNRGRGSYCSNVHVAISILKRWFRNLPIRLLSNVKITC